MSKYLLSKTNQTNKKLNNKQDFTYDYIANNNMTKTIN